MCAQAHRTLVLLAEIPASLAQLSIAMNFSPHTVSSFAVVLGVTAALPATAQTTGGGIFDDGGGAGVPHVLIEAEAGPDGPELALVFDEVLPVPTTGFDTLSTLFPDLAPTLDSSIATLLVAVGAGPGTTQGFTVPGTSVTTFESISSPAAGADTGFVNDDNGFESEGVLPVGTDINVTFATPDGAANDPFFVALGTNLFTNIGDPVIGALSGEGFEVLDDGEVIDLITGAVLADFFSLGDAFEAHPLFGLNLEADDAIGAALIDVTLSDAGGQLAGSTTFRFLLTNNPAAFQAVPDPATAFLLALGTAALLRRRR